MISMSDLQVKITCQRSKVKVMRSEVFLGRFYGLLRCLNNTQRRSNPGISLVGIQWESSQNICGPNYTLWSYFQKTMVLINKIVHGKNEPLLEVVRVQGKHPLTHTGSVSMGQNIEGSRENENSNRKKKIAKRRRVPVQSKCLKWSEEQDSQWARSLFSTKWGALISAMFSRALEGVFGILGSWWKKFILQNVPNYSGTQSSKVIGSSFVPPFDTDGPLLGPWFIDYY